MNLRGVISVLFSFTSFFLVAQIDHIQWSEFSRADSLRGMLTEERSCFDVRFYDLSVSFDIDKEEIKGSNIITFDLLRKSKRMQLDLFENMKISSILIDSRSLKFEREFGTVFIQIDDLLPNKQYKMTVNYEGSPHIAKNPPWDGGFIWSKDEDGKPWIHVSCQGIGASLWWPNKDHLSDEPDSMKISLTVPKPLKAISNGNLIKTNELGNQNEYVWKVHYPINNYNVTFSLGHYVHFSTTYESPKKGTLLCDYYVMPYNLDKAKEHFTQVNGVLEAFEFYLGPYPFWEDGYALVETPYLGMEHQSAIAYGNQYKRGYLGQMLPQDMNWDYIIVHETGHEYWGNAVSVGDFAELWLHESFTTYMEALYVEYHWGEKQANLYLQSQKYFENSFPIIGPLNVNFHDFKDSDHYFKGSWILYTLRNTIDNDSLFFSIIKEFYEDFKFKSATSKDFFELVNRKTKKDFTAFWQQYLYLPDLPTLEYKLIQKGKALKFSYRWKAQVDDFEMRIKVRSNNGAIFITPITSKWQSTNFPETDISEFMIYRNHFLMNTKKIQD